MRVRDVSVPRATQVARLQETELAKQVVPDALETPDLRIFYPAGAEVSGTAGGRSLIPPICTPAGCLSAPVWGSAPPLVRRIGNALNLRFLDEDAPAENVDDERQTHPLVAFVHPLYGSTFEQWTQRNDAMLRHLASHGYVVLATLHIPGECGVAGVSAVDGVTPCSGLPPGQYPLEVYLRAAKYVVLVAIRRSACKHRWICTYTSYRLAPEIGTWSAH